jgi:hypothetical protein
MWTWGNYLIKSVKSSGCLMLTPLPYLLVSSKIVASHKLRLAVS